MAARKGPLRADKLKYLPIDALHPGRFQPRQAMDGTRLRRLAESIRSQGVLQPLFVRKISRGRFEIIAGERRWLAAKMAGLEKVPAVVRKVADNSAVAIALVENLQREDLNPIDQAQAIKRLVETFSMTHQEVAETVGRSRATVTNLLRLLDLSPAVMAMVADGQLDMGHARALLVLPADQQRSAAQCVVAGDLSVREVERMVKQATDPEVAAPAIDKPAIPEPPVVAQSDGLWAGLTKRLGAAVGLKRQNNGRWRMNITFSDLDELRLALRAIDDSAAYLQQASPEKAPLVQVSPEQAPLSQVPHEQAPVEPPPHGLPMKANRG